MLPQIIVLCLMFGSFILHCAKHGEQRDNYNGWTALIAIIIQFLILYWGGFFKVLGW